MSTKSRIYGVPVLLIILLSGCAKGAAGVRQSAAAAALFQQFETVFSSKADLLSGTGAHENLSKQDANALRVPFAYLLAALDSLGNGASSRLLEDSEKILVGAKDFRPPAGLGGVRSQSCYVLVLRKRSTFDLRKYLHQSPVTSSGGMPVWNWSAKLGEFGEKDPRASSLYAIQVAQSYVVVSNDLEDLQTVAERLASPHRDSQELNSIREWASVSQHDVWGYRRYRHNGIANRDAAGMTYITPGAEALIFFLVSGKEAGVLQLLSSPTERTATNINATAKLPPLRAVSSGVWKASIPLSGDQGSSERMVVIMWLFGFGLYL